MTKDRKKKERALPGCSSTLTLRPRRFGSLRTEAAHTQCCASRPIKDVFVEAQGPNKAFLSFCLVLEWLPDVAELFRFIHGLGNAGRAETREVCHGWGDECVGLLWLHPWTGECWFGDYRTVSATECLWIDVCDRAFWASSVVCATPRVVLTVCFCSCFSSLGALSGARPVSTGSTTT